MVEAAINLRECVNSTAKTRELCNDDNIIAYVIHSSMLVLSVNKKMWDFDEAFIRHLSFIFTLLMKQTQNIYVVLFHTFDFHNNN